MCKKEAKGVKLYYDFHTVCKNDGSLHMRLDGAPVGTVVIYRCYFCV